MIVPESVVEDGKVILTIAPVSERVDPSVPLGNAGDVRNVEVEKRGSPTIARPLEVGRVGGVERGPARGVGVVCRVFVDGASAREDRREVVAPGPKIVVEVDFVEPGTGELADPCVKPVFFRYAAVRTAPFVPSPCCWRVNSSRSSRSLPGRSAS